MTSTAHTFFAPAKINLTLNVKRKLPTGYHELSTIMAAIPLADELSFELNHDQQDQEIYISSHPELNITSEKNLIYQAAQLLHQKYNLSPGFKCHLVKRIPLQAGLGGGSSNAATTLKALNQLYQLQLSTPTLLRLARHLGSDVPFFITGQVQLEENHGHLDQDTQLQLLPSLPPTYLLVLKPNFAIATAQAFAQLDQEKYSSSRRSDSHLDEARQNIIQALHTQNLELLAQNLGNDFSSGLFQQFPFYHQVSTWLFKHQALNATITGSGSALYSFFHPDHKSLPQLTNLVSQISREFPQTQTFLLDLTTTKNSL